MSDPSIPPTDSTSGAAPAPEAPTTNTTVVRAGAPVWLPVIAAAMVLLALAAIGLAWQGQMRLKELEKELVRRQESSQGESSEARSVARQSAELTRENAAKVALLEARVAEVSLQRTQLEDLIQSMSRSRDENLLGDIEAALRLALQQVSITGSAEPLVAALRQSDERLARHKQPHLEGVRRAAVRDLERVKSVSVVDAASLAIKLDEVVRLLDEMPMLAGADKGSEPVPARQSRVERAPTPAKAGAKPASGAAADGGEGRLAAWWQLARDQWLDASRLVWDETKDLVRVTRIEHPEAVLLAPEQAFFLRENLKLRLLNARLALLSRQFDTAQADLRETLSLLDRYFDARSRKVRTANELLRQVAGQARQINVPRPDDTLAAIAAAAGR